MVCTYQTVHGKPERDLYIRSGRNKSLLAHMDVVTSHRTTAQSLSSLLTLLSHRNVVIQQLTEPSNPYLSSHQSSSITFLPKVLISQKN